MSKTKKKPCRVHGCQTLTSGIEGYCQAHRDRSIVRRYKSLVIHAKKKNETEVGITLSQYEELIEDNTCFYCKGPLSPTGYGLDKIDAKRGYTSDNLIACCGNCNRIKGAQFTMRQTMMIIDFIREMEYNNWISPNKRVKGEENGI